jgi:hypothetical protein
MNKGKDYKGRLFQFIYQITRVQEIISIYHIYTRTQLHDREVTQKMNSNPRGVYDGAKQRCSEIVR